MDDRPSSDHTNTTLTIMLIWIVTGVILVCAAFFIAHSSDPWFGFNAAGAVAALYLIALTLYIARKPLRILSRVTVVVLAIIVVGGTAYTWINTQRIAREQKESRRLQGIASMRGNLYFTISQELLQTLQAYYKGAGKNKETLKDVFLRRHGPAKGEEQLTSGGKVWLQYTLVHLRTLEADSIVLVGISRYHKGRDPGFKNVDGTRGGIQEQLALTRKGVVHESQN
jgi:energy-coupling factor transporter transmembrane protein EcfT